MVEHVLPADDPLSDDALTGSYRVFQRVKGHRYSIDDVGTAYEAVRARRDALRCCDLGCGIGSVLLMVAYKLEDARFDAVEAQEISFELATRNIERNGQTGRIALHHGDLRDPAVHARLRAPFDLVTGTPPYVPEGKSTPAPDSQKAHARVERRGGVEAYVEAMSKLLAPSGRAVLCGDARTPERVLDSAERHGLRAIRIREFVPREGRPPLFTVFVLAHADEVSLAPERAEPYVARTRDGERTESAFAIREFFGLPAHRRT